jgi:hypothetical protein
LQQACPAINNAEISARADISAATISALAIVIGASKPIRQPKLFHFTGLIDRLACAMFWPGDCHPYKREGNTNAIAKRPAYDATRRD